MSVLLYQGVIGRLSVPNPQAFDILQSPRGHARPGHLGEKKYGSIPAAPSHTDLPFNFLLSRGMDVPWRDVIGIDHEDAGSLLPVQVHLMPCHPSKFAPIGFQSIS